MRVTKVMWMMLNDRSVCYNVYDVNKKNKRESVQIEGWEDID
jgi:hypothetical protein